MTEPTKEMIEAGDAAWLDAEKRGLKMRETLAAIYTAMSAASVDDEMVERGNCDAVTLVECPIGLFWHGDTLCLKTEYGNNEGRIDAYIIESGEFYWGDAPQTIASQRAQLVVPIDTDEAIAALAAVKLEGVGEP